jgi:hypothetical protein
MTVELPLAVRGLHVIELTRDIGLSRTALSGIELAQPSTLLTGVQVSLAALSERD